MNRTLFSATIRLDAGPYTRSLAQAKMATRAFSQEADKASRSHSRFANTASAAASSANRGFFRSLQLGTRAASGFERTLGFVERRVRGFARLMRYNLLFGSIGLSAMFTGGVAAGIKFNATMEQNEIALKNFLGSTKAARKEMEILYKIAKTTPFEVADVTDAARKFLAFGFNVRQTNTYLRTLADAAASTGAGAESMQRIVLAIGQIQAKGRVQGDELLQLTEAGIPAYRILQKELGLSREQMQQIGKEQIPAGKAIEALMRGMDKLYGGASRAQARTFFGMWSTFKDNANQTLGAITRGLFDETKEWMRSVNRFAEFTTEVFRGEGSFGTKFSRVWHRLTEGLNEWLDGGGKEDIAAGARKFGEIFAGAINTIFGVGGGGDGEKSPFYRAGSTAVTSFAKGFKDSLKGGEILTSPLGRALETYLLVRWGIKKLRGKGGGVSGIPGGGGGPAGVATDLLGATPATAMWVRMAGGGVPIPGGRYPGDRIPGGPAPYPTGKPPSGGAPSGGASRAAWLTKGAAFAAGAGYFAGGIMASDAIFRPDHDPFATPKAIGSWAGYGLRDLAGKKTYRDLSQEELRKRSRRGVAGLRGEMSGWWIDDEKNTKQAASRLGLNAIIPPSITRRSADKNKKGGQLTALAYAFGIKDQRAVNLTQSGAAGLVAAFEKTLAQKAAASTAGSALANTAGTIGAEIANLAGMPSAGVGDATGDAPPAYQIGKSAGINTALQMMAGAKAGMSTALTSSTSLPPGASGGTSGGLGGNWGGSQALAEAMANLSGLPVSSRKRNVKYTASGGISDHWVGSTDAYAVDLATSPPAGDPIAARLAAAMGVPGYEGGYWLNKNINGYRYQLGWRTPGHFDHIHLGVNRLHGGGTFRAPSRGGEGLALLRDGERISPAGASRGRGGRALTVHLKFSGEVGGSGSVNVDEIASRVAALVVDAANNMTLEPVE